MVLQLWSNFLKCGALSRCSFRNSTWGSKETSIIGKTYSDWRKRVQRSRLLHAYCLVLLPDWLLWCWWQRYVDDFMMVTDEVILFNWRVKMISIVHLKSGQRCFWVSKSRFNDYKRRLAQVGAKKLYKTLVSEHPSHSKTKKRLIP